MDKYNSKTSFQKWFSSINLKDLSEEAKKSIQSFDSYSKKLNFETTLKIFLHAVYEEMPSYREIGRAFQDKRLVKEIGIDAINFSNLSRKMPEMEREVLIEIFQQLVAQI